MWWAVLAVALGLMALVATMSLTGHTPPARIADAGHEGRGGPSTTAGGRPTSVGSSPSSPTTASTIAPTTEPPGTGRSAAASPTPVPSTVGGTVGPTGGTGPADGTGGDPATTGTSPAVAPTTSSSTSPPALTTTTTVPAAQTFAGYLAYPDDVSATYQTAGGATVSATATWTGTPTLSLTITCTSHHVSRIGQSGISLAVTDDHNVDVPCNVTLAEPPSEEGTASYALSVSLASG